MTKKDTTKAVPDKGAVQIGDATFSKAGVGLPTSVSRSTSRNGMRYIPCTGDSIRFVEPNLYYEQIARLAYESPTNGAALRRKGFMIKGEGFDLSSLPRPLRLLLENINGEGEDINDVLEKIALEYTMFGGFALEITWGNDGFIRYVEHVPFTSVRVAEEGAELNGVAYDFCISNNWNSRMQRNRQEEYVLPRFNPSYFTTSTKGNDGVYSPNEEQVQQSVQLIYYFNASPMATDGQEFYPIPDYIAGLDAIETEVSIGISNKSKIDNGINGKTLIRFPFKTTEEEKAKNDLKLKQNFSGAYNEGAVITMYVSEASQMPEITQIQDLDANTYIELEKSIKQNIITAHQVPAILVEYNYGGGFNNRAQEMIEAYSMFQQTYIKSYQQNIIRVFNKIIGYMDYPEVKLSIVPFTLTNPTTPVTADGGTNIQS